MAHEYWTDIAAQRFQVKDRKMHILNEKNKNYLETTKILDTSM